MHILPHWNRPPLKETFTNPSQIPCGVLKLDLHLTFTKPLRTGLLITSFYWWGNWGLGSLHNPSKVTKLREADDDPTLRAKLTGRPSILSQLFKKFRNPGNPQSAFQSSLYHRRQWRWKCGGKNPPLLHSFFRLALGMFLYIVWLHLKNSRKP